MWKNQKLIIRIVAWLLIIGMVAVFLIDIAFAEQAIPSTPPQNVTVTDIAYADSDGQNWYVEFRWGAPTFPPEATGDRSQTFYFNRIERGSGQLTDDVLSFTMNGTDSVLSTRSYGIELDNGKIYEFYGRSNYTWGEFKEYSFTSGRSNKVKFLTDVEFSAELISGTNEIKIVWDDVWDTDGRIDYRILISDTSGFTQPPSIPDIIGSEIGTDNSRVTVNGERLEYVYSNAMPGREYSIKVIPLADTDVARVPDNEIPIVRVKTEILLRAKKMGETSDGVRWMLFWDPIIKGGIGSTTFTKVEYKLYRYDTSGVETFFALVTDKDRYEMNLRLDEINKYKFKIEAIAYKPDGSTVPFYSTTQVSLIEQIPEYPSSPEFVTSFPSASPAPINYDDLLGDTSATLLWLAPQTGEGKIDTEIYYDLYLVNNLEDMKNLPLTKKIGSNLTIPEESKIRDLDTGKIIGYKYKINQLQSNSVYYAILIAKKNFLTESPEGGFMVTRAYESEPSVKVIITKPGTDTDKPLAPPSPPFRVKPGTSPEKNGFTLQMEKSWTEMYNPQMEKWLYVVRQDDAEAGQENSFYRATNSYSYQEYLQNNSLPAGDPEKKPVRNVSYKAGWEINIHVVEYSKALERVKEMKQRDFITYSDLKQSYLLTLQKQLTPVTIPDLKEQDPQMFSMPVTQMDPNTTYLVWVTVRNNTGAIESDPSDPILVTTQPDTPSLPEKPVVPTDLKGVPSATYVDLFWTARQKYSYNIRYGITDDRAKATGSMTVTAAQLAAQPWARVAGLDADTIYYFWIQAVSNDNVLSEWSNAIMVKTEKHNPPPRPRGFGIKDTPDAISETSVFYEWILDESVTYILEISENADFSESKEYSTNGSEYQVTGLRSNYRYFARLFAKSTTTGLRSEPTAVIMIVTRKGRGEYDADVPLDDVPKGDMVVIDAIAENGIWKARVLGINGHRLSEKIRTSAAGTFAIDLSNPPPGTRTIRVELSGEVVETLSGVRKSLQISTPGFDMVISPGSFLSDTYFRTKQSLGDIVVRVDVRTPANELIPETRWQFDRPATDMQVLAGVGNSFLPLGDFTRPLRVLLPVENRNIEQLHMRFFDTDKGRWTDVDSKYLPAEETMMVYPVKSGAVAALRLQPGNIGSGAGSEINTAVRNLTSLYPMPSLPAVNVNPARELTIGEGLKLLFDLIPYAYGNEDVVQTAQRAGFLVPMDHQRMSALLRRDEAVYAAVRLLGKKTAQRIPTDYTAAFEDYSMIKEEYRQACTFAAANGIITAKGSFNPDKTITLGEWLVILEKILQLSGEL